MKTKTQIIIFFTVVFLLFSVFWHYATAQTKINALAGFKSLELGTTITNEESELIYGVSASVVDSKASQDRANNNDKGKHHEFNGDVVPTCFGLIGAKFDRLNIIGKIGGAYVSQSINNEPTKDLFLALGIMASLKVSNSTPLVLSYDSVNSVQLGISLSL
jgi:hypothetical protein